MIYHNYKKFPHKVNLEMNDLLTLYFNECYFCTRVWSAWGYNTMKPDDFCGVEDDEDYLDEFKDMIFDLTEKFYDETRLKTELRDSLYQILDGLNYSESNWEEDSFNEDDFTLMTEETEIIEDMVLNLSRFIERNKTSYSRKVKLLKSGII